MPRLPRKKKGGCPQVPRLPRETKEDVAKCHACHAKRRWLSPSATPTTQNEGGCHQVPRLPRLPRKVPRGHRRPSRPCAPRSAISGTPATQNEGGCDQLPRLPRETKEDVAKCHAYHAKKKVDVTKCHACHVKRRRMSPSATSATQSEGGCHQVPAYHAKRRWMSPSARPATQSADRRPSRPSAPPSAISATPATQNEGGCHQVPRLPRETKEDVAKKTKVDVTKCHACHAKCRGLTGDQAVQARHAVP